MCVCVFLCMFKYVCICVCVYTADDLTVILFYELLNHVYCSYLIKNA